MEKIKKNKEFKEVYTTGKRHYFQNTAVFFTKTNDPQTYYGITTSKKFKTAVERNKARRRVFNIIKNEQFAEKIKFVILVKDTARKISYDELKKELLRAFSKLKLIK